MVFRLIILNQILSEVLENPMKSKSYRLGCWVLFFIIIICASVRYSYAQTTACNGGIYASAKYACVTIDAGAFTPKITGYGDMTVTVLEGTPFSIRTSYGFNSAFGNGCSASIATCYFNASDSERLLLNGAVIATNSRFNFISYSSKFSPGKYEISSYIPEVYLKSNKIMLVVLRSPTNILSMVDYLFDE